MGLLDEKIAVVIGGASGIGLAIAARFANEGAIVYVTGRREADVTAAAARIGPAARPVMANAASPRALRDVFSRVRREQGRVDTLVVNAGMAEAAALADIDETLLDRHIELNLRAPIFAIQAALCAMPAGGSVVLVGSIAASIGTPQFGAYNATKAGLRSLARTFANELAERRIRVNVVAPGPTETPMFADTAPEVREALSARIPLGRLGRPDEVAAAALFLASGESSYVTGVELPVDGGMAQV